MGSLVSLPGCWWLLLPWSPASPASPWMLLVEPRAPPLTLTLGGPAPRSQPPDAQPSFLFGCLAPRCPSALPWVAQQWRMNQSTTGPPAEPSWHTGAVPVGWARGQEAPAQEAPSSAPGALPEPWRSWPQPGGGQGTCPGPPRAGAGSLECLTWLLSWKGPGAGDLDQSQGPGTASRPGAPSPSSCLQ